MRTDDVQSCNDDIWQGLSSNRACCVCGGGHRSAHPWRYWVGPQAVGGTTEIDVHPMPRTANRYLVDQKCDLARYGLKLDGQTGAITLLQGCGLGCCAKVTCGEAKPFSLTCTVTAIEEPLLESSALLNVKAEFMAYMQDPIVEFAANDAPWPLKAGPALDRKSVV